MELPKLRSLADHLVGAPISFNLEARVFHSVCLLMIAGAGINVAFNLLAGLPQAAWLMLAVFAACSAVYYFSRFRHQTKITMPIFLFGCNVVLGINYYFNSGLDGPTYAICLLFLLITISVAPRRQYLLWVPLNLLVMGALFGADYFYPGWVIFNYQNRGSRFADFTFTYLVIAALIVFVVANIRKAYQQERRLAKQRTAELGSANDVKNKLLSIVAHDLKEPLTSIMSFLELLTDKDIDGDQRLELEHELLLRTQNASELLNNVLTWTRGQMEGIQARKIPVQLAEVLKPVIGLMGPLADEKAISLVSSIPVSACVIGDPDMLQLVIRNLLTNAIKYSHPGGNVRLTTMSSYEHCVISVKDDGDGIPLSQQAGLFSLETSPANGTQQEKGAGLGLYLCRDFMERQGGTIAFTTEAGLGTTFMISLPCRNDRDH